MHDFIGDIACWFIGAIYMHIRYPNAAKRKLRLASSYDNAYTEVGRYLAVAGFAWLFLVLLGSFLIVIIYVALRGVE